MPNNPSIYSGVVIRESLKDDALLVDVAITNTNIEAVTEHHRTPWLKQWTLDTVEIPPAAISSFAERISQQLNHNYWYADFKNSQTHIIVFPGKVFTIDRSKPQQYEAAVAYGLQLNIPSYQLDFSPVITQWHRDQSQE